MSIFKNFRDYVETIDNVYLHPIPCYFIIRNLQKYPEICENEILLRKYLSNCLRMDGFGFKDIDIENIKNWITQNVYPTLYSTNGQEYC